MGHSRGERMMLQFSESKSFQCVIIICYNAVDIQVHNGWECEHVCIEHQYHFGASVDTVGFVACSVNAVHTEPQAITRSMTCLTRSSICQCTSRSNG
jgi:hypothetical protein